MTFRVKSRMTDGLLQVNNMITERYPAFWKSEKRSEGREEVCLDCGQRLGTRGQIQKHLGVEHNLLWDHYLAAVQKQKQLATTSPGETNEEKRLSKSIKGKGLGKTKKGKQKNTRKKSNHIRPRKPVALSPTSAYRDSKLSLIPDTNPYSKKFLFNAASQRS